LERLCWRTFDTKVKRFWIIDGILCCEAHLKLDMLLTETGYKSTKKRGV
jgi:hypothetical protein